jgi:hypothetical protein
VDVRDKRGHDESRIRRLGISASKLLGWHEKTMVPDRTSRWQSDYSQYGSLLATMKNASILITALTNRRELSTETTSGNIHSWQ